MSSLSQVQAEPVAVRGTPRSLRYLPHVLVATAVVSLVPIAIVWALRDRGVISSAWVALPLAIALSLLAAAGGRAVWSRRRRAVDLMFSELLLWGWLRRLYIDHKVERAVGQLSSPNALDHAGNEDMAIERRAQPLTELAAALEAQDPYLEGHSRRVARHTTMIARKIGLGEDVVSKMRLAALLHDVGKLRVPQGILNKPGKLTTAEFDQVKRHPGEGANMVAGLGDDELTSIVRHHHERLDGAGYPDGLRGLYIPLGARIIAVADMYDAITAARPYRPAAPHKQALDTLRDESLTHLDPALVHAFRSSYSGRGPLALWVSLGAWMQAVHFLPPGAPVTAARRLSLRELVATTLTTTMVAVAAIAAPIGARAGESHPAATATARTIAPAPSRAHKSTPGLRRGHPAPLRARRSTRIVAHRATASAIAIPLTASRLAQTRTIRGGQAPPSSQLPSSPHTSGPASPGTHAPRPASPPTLSRPRPHPTPPRPPTKSSPRPPTTTSPRPPTAVPISPVPTTPGTPVNGAPQTSTPPATSPAGRPASKDACKNGGYANYGFSNQGQCVAAAEHRG